MDLDSAIWAAKGWNGWLEELSCHGFVDAVDALKICSPRQCSPILQGFGAVISSASWELAVHVLDSMLLQQILPDIVCYNAASR